MTSKTITITMPVEFVGRVKSAAKQQDIPLSCLIRHAVVEYMNKGVSQ